MIVDKDIEKEVAWDAIVVKTNHLNKVVLTMFGITFTYLILNWLFEFSTNKSIDFILIFGVAIAKYYAGFKTNQLHSAYYKKYPIS